MLTPGMQSNVILFSDAVARRQARMREEVREVLCRAHPDDIYVDGPALDPDFADYWQQYLDALALSAIQLRGMPPEVFEWLMGYVYYYGVVAQHHENSPVLRDGAYYDAVLSGAPDPELLPEKLRALVAEVAAIKARDGF